MRKHLLYLTNTELTVRLWRRNRLSEGIVFQNGAAGWQALSDYLSAYQHVPAFILMDLIEEDFQRDTIPHVIGKTRKNLIERRLLQLYRDTPFRHASRQGREKTGRKDDVMLFNALTNTALIKPWIDAIHAQQVPVAGIFSAALLSAALLRKLAPPTGPVLLITHQSSGLRQNFFQNGQLRFSRLIQSASERPEAMADLAIQEIAKTRLFLANARLLQRGESLQVVAIDNPAMLNALQAQSVDSGDTSYQTISLEQAARTLGQQPVVQDVIHSGVADTLILALLASTAPASHYELPEQSHTYVLWQIRLALYILSFATLLGSVLWSGATAMEAINTGKQLHQHQVHTEDYRHRLALITASMPKTRVNPHDMKAAVDLHARLLQNSATPKDMMNMIAAVLEKLPQLRIDEYDWEVSDSKDPAASATQPPNTVDGVLIGLPDTPAQSVTLKGEIAPFDNNYRAALNMVNQLALELRKNSHLQVTLVHLPLDTRSTVALTGQAGQSGVPDQNILAPAASFDITISWKP